MIKVSVIIPVKNGSQTLRKCLDSIIGQSIAADVEIIILDSCSTDDSVSIAKQVDAKVITIPQGAFNHGDTRNLGVNHASGDLLFFTVQDAYLPDKDQLQKMVSHFDDVSVMAITGMQAVPHDRDKNPALWFKRFSKPSAVFKQILRSDFILLSDQEKYNLVVEWDDVHAMYRRAALRIVPFEKTDFAEDKLWARSALLKGMKIGFDPSLVVYHYHHSTFTYTFDLEYTVNYHIYKHFRIFPNWPVFFRTYLSNIYQLWKNNLLTVKEKIYWSMHNFARLSGYAVSTTLFIVIGKFLGNRNLDKSFRLFCNKVPQGKSK